MLSDESNQIWHHLWESCPRISLNGTKRNVRLSIGDSMGHALCNARTNIERWK